MQGAQVLPWSVSSKILQGACVLAAQLCLILCHPMNCSPPGSCPWDFPGKNTGVGCRALLLTQRWNPGLLNCNQSLHHLSHQGSPTMCMARQKKNQTIHKNLKINIQAETLSCVLSEVTFPNFLCTSHFPSQKGVWSQARSAPGGLGRKGEALPWWPRG